MSNRKNIKYDFLIVGAGLFGAVCANILSNNGKKVLIVEKRKVIAGNCYTERNDDIYVHKYGAHIFHTDNECVWEYINKFTIGDTKNVETIPMGEKTPVCLK